MNEASSVVENKKPLEEKKAPPVSPDTSESFLGSMLVIALVLILIGVTAFFGFFGYRVWRQGQAVKNAPSIERLSFEKTAPPVGGMPSESKEETPTTPASSATEVNKATLEVKVLNGGAAKGSAGTFTETLKKAGYTKAAVGNSIRDYKGVTVYFAKDKETEAQALKEDVVKTYPSAITAPALANDKDSASAPLVVILGR
ncbi:MAG: LytR C-terminal domain-containing protein [Candidatus Moraniibacteriota bacterium]